MKPIELNDSTFESAISGADKPILVDFWATWCGPCRAMAPILEQIASKDERLIIAKVDVDKCPDTAQKFGIMSIPTMILFKAGRPVTQLVGARPKNSVMAELNPYL